MSLVRGDNLRAVCSSKGFKVQLVVFASMGPFFLCCILQAVLDSILMGWKG
jgi:hypothetical protein